MSEYTMSALETQLAPCPPQEIPHGFCQCGCGRKTKISQYGEPNNHIAKGQPRRYCCGHNLTHHPWPARFWRHVSIRSENECWVWQGRINSTGYGRVGNNGKVYYAHRMAYELCVGPIPKGLCVLHACDNRRCVNVRHLFLGTDADNVHDAIAKGRMRYVNGSRVGAAKLTEQQVIEIRSIYETGHITQRELGAKYHVSHSTIGRITRREGWNHV